MADTFPIETLPEQSNRMMQQGFESEGCGDSNRWHRLNGLLLPMLQFSIFLI
ncbi:MAG: hypothetical protein ACI92E_001306 [Oceanicoccus sp.]